MSAAHNGPSPERVVDGAGNGAGPDRRLRLGGMALRNGLLIHGPHAWAAAARTPDGRIEVSSGPKPAFSRGRLGSAPLIRGPLRLAEAFAVVPIARRGLPAARLPIEDPRVLVVALATALASRGIRRLGPATAASETVIAALGVLPAVTALRDRDLAAYHGVEHKAIGAYERGSFDPTDAPKEHERCGSNLIVPLLILSTAGQLIVERLFSRPGPVARAVAAVASTSGAVELFAFAERRPDSGLGRAIHAIGHQIQRFVSTREPTAEQLEVGAAALQEVLRAEAASEAGVPRK
ncbi:MAG: DUF1385 domain-containing protein [Solirubrobacterales bacterium]